MGNSGTPRRKKKGKIIKHIFCAVAAGAVLVVHDDSYLFCFKSFSCACSAFVDKGDGGGMDRLPDIRKTGVRLGSALSLAKKKSLSVRSPVFHY